MDDRIHSSAKNFYATLHCVIGFRQILVCCSVHVPKRNWKNGIRSLPYPIVFKVTQEIAQFGFIVRVICRILQLFECGHNLIDRNKCKSR